MKIAISERTRYELRATAAVLALFWWFVMLCGLGSCQYRPAAVGVSALAAYIPAEDPPAEVVRAEPERSRDAELLAKLAYGAALYNSEAAQRAAMECALNRVDSALYPNTIEAVVTQPSQWMGWSEENPVLDELYELACDVLADYGHGYQSIPRDCLWFTWNGDDGITFRTSFTEGKGCNYWEVP